MLREGLAIFFGVNLHMCISLQSTLVFTLVHLSIHIWEENVYLHHSVSSFTLYFERCIHALATQFFLHTKGALVSGRRSCS